MSADTTVMMVGRRFSVDGPMMYTAAVVQNAGMAYDEEDGYTYLEYYFRQRVHPWFRSLSRAKQFANLIAEEQREFGILEYSTRPFLEMGIDRKVYRLSRRGNRIGLACQAPVLATDTSYYA